MHLEKTKEKGGPARGKKWLLKKANGVRDLSRKSFQRGEPSRRFCDLSTSRKEGKV